MKALFSQAALGALIAAACASATDYQFPSANPPGNLSPSTVKQFVTFIFDDNGYSGASQTQYEYQPGTISWADRAAVGGSDINGTTKDPLKIKEGDMGIAWALAKLGGLRNPDASPVHLTFNMITGLFLPTWGPSWQDRSSKFGSYTDPANPYVDENSGFKNIAVAWGREQQIGMSAGKSDVQPNYMLTMVTKVKNAGHEIGNHTLDHMETNSPLPQSEFDTWGGDGFDPGLDTMADGSPCVPDEATTFGIESPDAFALNNGWNMFAGQCIGREAWKGSIALSEKQLDLYLNISVLKQNLFSFRAPRLEVNSDLFFALNDLGYTYDCGLEEGYETADGPATALWPYTFDNGSPNVWTQKVNGEKINMQAFPTGLWEIPVNAVVVPDSLRARIYAKYHKISLGAGEVWAYNAAEVAADSMDWCYGEGGGKITAFDFNMFILYGMTKAEFLATMKYNLDVRMAHGKAPLQFGCHTDYYTPIYDNATLLSDFNKNSYGLSVTNRWNTWTDRKAAVEDFAKYAISRGAYIVSGKDLIAEMRKLAALDVKGAATVLNGAWDFFDYTQGAIAGVGRFSGSANAVSVSTPSSYSSCGYALGIENSSLAGLDHISLNYQTSTALSLRLVSGSGSSWEVLLGNIGPAVNSGAIPLSAFRLSPDNTGSDSILDPAQISSIELGVLNESETTAKTAVFSMSDFTVYGPVNPTTPLVAASTVVPFDLALRGFGKGLLKLECAAPTVCTVSLMTLSGRVVKTFANTRLDRGSNTLRVGALAKGSYVVSVKGLNFSRTLKAVMN